MSLVGDDGWNSLPGKHRRPYYAAAFVLVLLFVVLFAWWRGADPSHPEVYAIRFRGTALAGRIRAVGQTGKGSIVFMDSIPSPFYIPVLQSPQGQLWQVAAPGDSLMKKAYSPSILIRKKAGSDIRLRLAEGYY